MLLESKIGERFDAIVTGAAPKGTWVCLLHRNLIPHGCLSIGCIVHFNTYKKLTSDKYFDKKINMKYKDKTKEHLINERDINSVW
jgi:hypothetical protein